MSEASPLAGLLADWRSRFETQLAARLADRDAATARLHEGMRYSALGGGKRLRPILVYCTGTALSAPADLLDDAAAAVEMLHVYSLVHDDLPAMDDDDLRRGRPTCHKAFDEGTAVLVGDALQALAFEVLAGNDASLLPAAARLQQIQVLSRAIGTDGMAGGQAIDLAAVGKPLEPRALEDMHRRKTGALIRASVLLGAIGAGITDGPRYEALSRYGADLGLAFQIQDDVLDVLGETATLGKIAGADAARGKPTYPSILGLAESQRLARLYCDRAIGSLAGLGPGAAPLAQLADYVVNRSH
ncbi:MAG: farnesyl diphosphate synthase [Steroidobacteraceae bacterium]